MVGLCVWLVSGDVHEFRQLLHVKHVKQQCDRCVWDTAVVIQEKRLSLSGRVKPHMIVETIATHQQT